MDLKFWLGNLSEWLGVVAVVMIAGVSPLLKLVRRIEFRFPRRELTFSLSLFALVFFFAFQFFSNSIFNFLKIAASGFAGGEWAERLIIALIALIPFIIALIVRGQPLKSIGWGKDNLRAGLVTGLMLAVLVIFLRGKFLTLLKGIAAEQGGILLVFLLLCIAEETLFRGFIQLRLMSSIGRTWGWLLTTLLFVLWQLPGRVGVLPPAELALHLGLSTIQGLMLGWVMQKSGHVAAPALLRAVSSWIFFL